MFVFLFLFYEILRRSTSTVAAATFAESTENGGR